MSRSGRWGMAALCVLLAACDKNTPLMDKVLDGDKAAVDRLLAAGTPVDARNGYGWTAQTHATHHNKTELVALLLDHDTKNNARDQDGWTPLMRAAMKDHAD